MAISIMEGTVPDMPPDETPPYGEGPAPDPGWFDSQYPQSTKEHPYGYFPDKDGNPDLSRPRKRRPHSRSSDSTPGTIATSARADATARTAAKMLARMNGFIGIGLMSFGMPLSGEALKDANTVFEDMAYEALQTDPALARQILSAGATSGKAQLTMAYIMLGGQIAPMAFMELKQKRSRTDDDDAS